MQESDLASSNQEISSPVDPAVQSRIRTLIELAVAIGRREGLIGKQETN